MAVSKKKPPFALKGLTTDKRSVIIMATYRQNASYDFISKKPWDPATAEVIDDEGGTTNKNALPFGLCKKFGISLPDGARPRDAWEALKQHGVYPQYELLGAGAAGDHTQLSQNRPLSPGGAPVLWRRGRRIPRYLSAEFVYP